jgi:hypothetical protein
MTPSDRPTLTLPKKAVASGLADDDIDEPANVRDTHEGASVQAEVASTHVLDDRAWRDGRELTDEEFLASLQFDGGLNNILPKTPDVPGYHTMWASTTNEPDLRNRLDNLGYTFVKLEECPAYRNHTARSATIPGVVSFNEMVAVKIKKGREQLIAKRFHHDAPLNSEKAIKKKLSELMDYEGKKIGLTVEDGTESLGKMPGKAPTFSV